MDLLQSVRRLKALGIQTLFLTAGMDSLGESEFVLTLFGALAQEDQTAQLVGLVRGDPAVGGDVHGVSPSFAASFG